ncbi:S-adenosyl-L-methionine-dependent methyltransferase [Pseudomassariella vexata]|uniref:S-adenosyl-L-methionine-dependent methyltransferase n=1 Tax=Pseudomassariella vexata TaxID=1141098 RepID=A0A1Y2DIL3_9PEZI|nr:S-adenosyl-L-methionine-dependent methyltransferase [Pseudomassariella vexata]ORY59079.1 S-adenosyl-L-methionine-dependent methyltransferase [Pseudomassariella vexata]
MAIKAQLEEDAAAEAGSAGFAGVLDDQAADYMGVGLPEVDGSISADDVASVNERTAQYSGLIPDDDNDIDDGHYGVASMDAQSIYAPSRYFAASTRHGVAKAFDDGATLDSTRSMADSDVDYTWEHGRRYRLNYYMPNDLEEQQRLGLVHQVYCGVFDGELTGVPLEDPSLILDIGTGTGEWAMDMADRYPNCEVIGTDIAKMFSRQPPPNVFWEIDDAERDWERPRNAHDLVHFRNMSGAFMDWAFVYRQAYLAINPGGYIELLDFDDHKGFRNFFSFFEPGSLMHRVAQDLQEASVMSGRPRGVGHLEPRLLYDAGFADVQFSEHAIPINPNEHFEESTGYMFLLALIHGMEATILRLLTGFKGWSAEEVRAAVGVLAGELETMARDPKRAKGFVIKVRVLTGRKPLHSIHSDVETTAEDDAAMTHDTQVEMEERDDDDGYHSNGPYGGALTESSNRSSLNGSLAAAAGTQHGSISHNRDMSGPDGTVIPNNDEGVMEACESHEARRGPTTDENMVESTTIPTQTEDVIQCERSNTNHFSDRAPDTDPTISRRASS